MMIEERAPPPPPARNTHPWGPKGFRQPPASNLVTANMKAHPDRRQCSERPLNMSPEQARGDSRRALDHSGDITRWRHTL